MNRRPLVLVGALAAVGAVFLALRPTLERMRAETRRIDQETAQALEQAQKVSQARGGLEDARRAVALRPDDPAAQLALAAAAQSAGQTDEARAAAQAAARLLPGDPTPTLALADIAQRARRYDEAIDLYRDALKASPNLPRAVSGLGLIYLTLGWTLDARTLLEAAVDAHPDDRPLKTALALACVQHSEFARAERLLLELRADAPDDPTLWGALSDLYLKASRPKEAIPILQAARAKDPADIRPLVGLAQAHLAAGDLAAAEKAAGDGLALDPKNLPLHYHLALILQRTGRPADALPHLETVHAAAPDFENVRLLLGQAWIRAGRADEGRRLLDAYRRASADSTRRTRVNLQVSMKPRDPQAHLEMARIYQRENSVGRMRAELRRVLELRPGDPEATRLLKATP